MATKYERFAPLKDAPSDNDVTRIHNLLTENKGFFIDKELVIMLSRLEVDDILSDYMKRDGVDKSTVGDLIAREEIRVWGNLPNKYKIIGDRKISLMSIFEYILKRDEGIVESPGKFPSDKNQVALQKDVLSRILVQVPDWQKRIASY